MYIFHGSHVSLYFFFLDRRDDKAIINSNIQSGGTAVWIPVMTFGLTILAFLPVKLGLMRLFHCSLILIKL